MNRWLLTFNAGSSSIKLGVFRLADGDGGDDANASSAARKIGQGQLDLQRTPLTLQLEIEGVRSTMEIEGDPLASMERVLEQVLHQLEVGNEQGTLFAVGHRVVHGGLHLAEPVLLNTRIEDELEARPAAIFGRQVVEVLRARADGAVMERVVGDADEISHQPGAVARHQRVQLPRRIQDPVAVEIGIRPSQDLLVLGDLVEMPRQQRRRVLERLPERLLAEGDHRKVSTIRWTRSVWPSLAP